jgi:hypothetical protein
LRWTEADTLRLDASWDLRAPFGCDRMPDDYGLHPFTALVKQVLPGIAARADELEQVRRAVHVACRALLHNTPSEVLGIALTFAPRARMPVLRALLDDETGRLRQMAAACPGLLSLALEYERSHPEWLSRILAGDALNDIIDALGAALWPDLEPVSVRSWIRCAPAAVSAEALSTPPMWRVVRSDAGGEKWYAVMGDVGQLVRSTPGVAVHTQQAFCDYVSKHAALLVEPAQEHEDFWRGTYLGTRIESPRLCRSRGLQEWRADMAPYLKLLHAKASLPDDFDGHVQAPFPGPNGKRLTGRALTSIADLKREGKEMQHCIGHYGTKLLLGTAAYYALRHADGRVTLELERVGDTYWMWSALVGSRNTPPSRATARAVSAWLGRRGAITPAQMEASSRHRAMEAAE